MSSITGGSAAKQAENDPAFQLAPAEGEGPNLSALNSAFTRTMVDVQPYVDQCRQNYETRFAIWNGQSADGKKHAREGGGKIDPTPWDGASDLRVYAVDAVINYKVARNSIALSKANLVAVPVSGNDITRARLVSNFMKWLVNTQIPHLDREEELLDNYLQEKGIALTGQFWEICQEKTLVRLRLQDFQKQFPQFNVQAVVSHPELEEHLLAVIQEAYPTSKRKAKAVLRDLQQKGEADVPALGRKYSRPIIRAFNLDRDIFVPSWATDIESAPYIFRIEYFTAEQLRAFANNEGWDSDWVEAAILKCRGQVITSIPDTTLQPISRSFVYIDRKTMQSDLIGVVFGYQRLSDEDGVPGIYLTIFNPRLPKDNDQQGYAKFSLLGYAHGQYPFVVHRREYLSRKFHDSRGVPEPGKAFQDQIKAHRDSRIDAASLAIVPPFAYPTGRPPSRWGPGARIPERRPGEYHFLDKPTGDVNTEESENRLSASFKDYNGIASAEDDPLISATINQAEVKKWLASWSQVYEQVWKLYQQYGDDGVYFRVLGLQSEKATLFQKGDPSEDYDIYMSYDVLSMSPEQQTQKLENIAKICMTADKYGQIDYSQLLQLMLESVDPNIAERIILPKDAAADRFVKEEQDALAKIYAGMDQDIQLGSPAQLGLQVIQQYVQAPDVRMRMQSDKDFQDRLLKRAKQYEFQMTQANNAKIGRLGQ
jgi:hypothetical protein